MSVPSLAIAKCFQTPVAIPAPDPVIAVVVPTLRSTSPAARYARLRPSASVPLSLKSNSVALERPVVFEYAQNSIVKSVLVPNPRSPLEGTLIESLLPSNLSAAVPNFLTVVSN